MINVQMPDWLEIPTTSYRPLESSNKYDQAIIAAFKRNYMSGLTVVPFSRDDLDNDGLSNLGDVIYSYRSGRSPIPHEIAQHAPQDKHWQIQGAGSGQYQFILMTQPFFTPDSSLSLVIIPDISTVIGHDDEQAMLSKIRQNRLIDMFLGCRTCHQQSHLRTYIDGVGQIEIDDFYYGNDNTTGEMIAIPVQAKFNAQLSAVQISQDIKACRKIRSDLRVLPVGIIFEARRIVMMEFDNKLALVNERHYGLKPWL